MILACETNSFQLLTRLMRGAIGEDWLRILFTASLQKIPFFFGVNFWRTQAGAEVDFILGKGKDIIPIEVKYQEMRDAKIPVSFLNFLKKYRPRKGLILSKDYFGERKIGRTMIQYLPVHFLNLWFGEI